MKDCLVTRLKANVEDMSLSKLGELIITKRSDVPALNPNNVFIRARSSEEISFEMVSGVGFYTDRSLTTLTTQTQVVNPNSPVDVFVAAGTEVRILPRYNITELWGNYCYIDLSQLTYMNNLHTLRMEEVEIKEGGLEAVGHINSLTTLRLLRAQSAENVESLSSLTNLQDCNLSHCNSFIGSMAVAFGSNTNIEKLNIANTKVSGSIEDFVAAQIAAGRTSGTLVMPYAKQAVNVTFEGVSLANNSKVPALASTNQFSWTSDGTITWS